MEYQIRQLATSYDGSLFAAAEFEKKVYIWNIESAKKIVEIQTDFDFGGRRLAISSDGSLCAAGAYNSYGVSLFSTIDGSLLWKRKDLDKIQNIDFDVINGHIIVGMDEKPLHVLNCLTGNTMEMVRGVKAKWMSCYEDVYLLEKSSTLDIYKCGKKSFSIKRTTYAILTAAFSQDILFISEAAGPISAYWLSDGALAWRVYPEEGSHFLNIGYNNQSKSLYCVLWSYKNGGPKFLCTLESNSGTFNDRFNLDDPAIETCFAKRGSYFLTSNGDVYTLDRDKPKKIKTLIWASK